MGVAIGQRVPARVVPRRRRIAAAIIVPIVLYARSFVASWFFIKPLFMKINGAPCLRERKYAVPTIPGGMMFRLKLLWFQGVWRSTIQDHSPGIEKRFMKLISRIENYAESHFQEVKEEIPLPEYDWRNGTPEDFHDKFVKTPQPVVLRGFALQTEAVKKWSFDYILDKCGDVQVNLTTATEDRPGRLDEVRDPSIYCANADAPFKKCPELADDMGIPKLAPYLKRDNTWNQFFIGRKATGSGYHCAGIWNFFFMVEGRKKWTFVDPELSWMIYPNNNTGALAYASLVSFPDKADLSVYKLYKYCPRFSVTLEPGDVLFNPPWWWHSVDNLTPTSVAVATRWDALKGDFSFYEINRPLSMLAICNPIFPSFLHRTIINRVGVGQQLVRAGAGAFDEEDMIVEEANQTGRDQNAYQGIVSNKIRTHKKW